MSVNRSSLSRPIVLLVFAGLALAGVTTFLGQNPPSQTSRPPAAAAAPHAQPQPQIANQNPATVQPANPAAIDQRGQTPQAGQADRQPGGLDRANLSDSRQRRTVQHDEQEDAAWLGIFLSQRDNERGATVAQVYPSGPAARAGIYSGDVIQQINGQQVANGSDLLSVLDKLQPGEKAELTVLRDNEPTKLTATLGSRNSFASTNRNTNHYGGRAGQSNDDDQYNFPLHAMELEHNRRNADQHQRIENEIAKLRKRFASCVKRCNDVRR